MDDERIFVQEWLFKDGIIINFIHNDRLKLNILNPKNKKIIKKKKEYISDKYY